MSWVSAAVENQYIVNIEAYHPLIGATAGTAGSSICKMPASFADSKAGTAAACSCSDSVDWSLTPALLWLGVVKAKAEEVVASAVVNKVSFIFSLLKMLV